MSKVIRDPAEGTFKKFELEAFKEKEEEAERKKLRVDREFKPDFSGARESNFVLGGFDFEYGGGYRRDEIVKKTSDEVKAMLEDARARVSDIENEARERGYSEGLKKGKEEAINEVNSIMESLKKGIDSLMRTREEFFEKAEKEMVDLVALVSSEIVLREISRDNEIIEDVIRKAAGEIHSRQKIKIRINPADMENVKNMAEKLTKEVEAVEGVEFEPDRKISQGGCVIETNIGTLDATVENRLKTMHRSFRERLDNKR